MTPADIFRKLLKDLTFVAPEEVSWKLDKVLIAIKKIQKIHDRGIMTEAAEEAIQYLAMLKKYESDLRVLLR